MLCLIWFFWHFSFMHSKQSYTLYSCIFLLSKLHGRSLNYWWSFISVPKLSKRPFRSLNYYWGFIPVPKLSKRSFRPLNYLWGFIPVPQLSKRSFRSLNYCCGFIQVPVHAVRWTGERWKMELTCGPHMSVTYGCFDMWGPHVSSISLTCGAHMSTSSFTSLLSISGHGRDLDETAIIL
jgi:hypothetical protein